jgi:hypothetical protein
MQLQNRWFAGLVLAATVAGWSGGTAADQLWNSGQTLTVEPKMNFVPNTDVYYQRRAPGYDLYRYANRWYLVQGGDWHVADTWRGPFAVVDAANLPEAFTEVPQAYRQHWGDAHVESWASRRTFTKKPKMTAIAKSGVSYASQHSDFDLYRHKSSWYLIDDGVWYRSDSWKGPFMAVRANLVPRAVLNIPMSYRRHWQVPAAG